MTRRQAGWQGRRHATCPRLCWWGAAGAVDWRWPANGNLLRPGARACRLGGPAAWGLMPASSAEVSIWALHLTRTGRLWMARFRLLLLRSGGQVGHGGRRS
jgi:hypothetical protein